MKRIKISKNFYLDEFVPRVTYNKWGEKSMWFLDDRLVLLAQFFRDYFGAPMLINNWIGGGQFANRGYREPDSTVGAGHSQHKFGRAFDCNISGVTPDEMREEILRHSKKFLDAGLSTFERGEDAKTWLHGDIRQTGMDEIFIVGA